MGGRRCPTLGMYGVSRNRHADRRAVGRPPAWIRRAGACRAGRPGPRRSGGLMRLSPPRAGRRPLVGALAAAVLLVGAPAVLGATSAQAALTGPGVQAGHTIMVTPDIDFVGVYGYRTGTVIAVEVIRRNPGTGQDETIGRQVAPAVSTKTGVGLELNHGPTGTAQTLGACWAEQTPDIRPGDRVLVTQDGRSDEVTVDDIRWTSAPAVDPATGDVVVDGVAQRTDGSPIAATTLNGGQFRDDSGNYRI